MWMDARDAVDAVVLLDDRERLGPRARISSDRDDACHAGFAGARDCSGWIVERVEMRVGVDHAAAVGASTRGESGAAGAIPSAAIVRPGSTFSQARSSGWPSARKICRAARGREAGEATAATRRPSA